MVKERLFPQYRNNADLLQAALLQGLEAIRKSV